MVNTVRVARATPIVPNSDNDGVIHRAREWRFQLTNGSRVTLSNDAIEALREHFGRGDVSIPLTRMDFFTDDHTFVGSVVSQGVLAYFPTESGYVRKSITVDNKTVVEILPADKDVPLEIWKRVACPFCGAPVGSRCRTRNGKTSDSHKDRFIPGYPIFDQAEAERVFRDR